VDRNFLVPCCLAPADEVTKVSRKVKSHKIFQPLILKIDPKTEATCIPYIVNVSKVLCSLGTYSYGCERLCIAMLAIYGYVWLRMAVGMKGCPMHIQDYVAMYGYVSMYMAL